MKLPVLILALVFAMIAVRKIGKVRLQIWQVMLGGAAAALLTAQITPLDALRAVNPDVMLFLFGMFVVGHALEESGCLAQLAYRFFKRARSADALILFVLFGMGAGSAFLMNDTLAIVGTPVVLRLARRHGMSARLLLLALAFGVTTGSVASPIGNPQNLMIALDPRVQRPFVSFARFLFVPTLVNLAVAFFVLRAFYRDHFHDRPLQHEAEPIRDVRLAAIARVSLVLLLCLVGVKVLLVLAGVRFDFRLTWIALAAAAPVLAVSRRRGEILRGIDWHTLVFFAAMFVLMQSVWDCGFFQTVIGRLRLDITTTPAILCAAIGLSQLISNVPLVALYLPVLGQAGAATAEMMALAAGSTIAGNLFILGAASNVIIIQNAERKGGETLTFWEFARVGVPLTAVNALVYWLWFCVV